MSEKIRRNEDCPCGSGKKYKRCCLQEVEQKQSEKLPYQRMLDLEQKMIPKLVTFANEKFGEDSLDDAWNIFVDDGDEEPFEGDDPINVVFIPWYLYSWTLEGPHERRKPSAPMHQTVVETFIQARPNLLADEKRFLQAVNRRPFSLMEVKEVKAGESLTLYDLFLETTYVVTEKLEQTGLTVGEVVLAAIFWPIQDGEALLMSLGPYTIEAHKKPLAETFKAELLAANQITKISEDVLRDEQLNIFAYYFELIAEEEDTSQASPLKGLQPEVQKDVSQLFQIHWEEWLDREIPELEGQTPRQASRSEAGKVLLENLLGTYEQGIVQRPAHFANPDLKAIRVALGL